MSRAFSFSMSLAEYIRFERELKNVQAVESKVSGANTAEYAQKEQKIEDLNGKIGVYKAKLNETQAEEKDTAKQTANVTSYFKRLGSALKTTAANVGKVAKKATVVTFKKIGSAIKGMFTHTKKANGQMGILAKSLQRIKQALAGLLLYKILQGGLSSLKEGIDSLAKVNPDVNKNLSALLTSLTYLKNSLASAFAPILTVITPILTRFMDTLSAVTNKVGQFIATLTGQSTYSKAIKVQQDYAASLDDTTKATENNTQATEENQKNLAAYDQLNVMQQDNDTKATTADTTADNTGTLFETVPTVFSEFATKLKEAFSKGDFNAIGQLVADKLNKAMSSIKWNKIRSTAKKWASNIAGFLNGAVEKLDWFLTGTTIGNGIMTAVDFAYTFLTKFDFKKFGQGISNAFNSLFKNFDAKTIGKALAEVVNMVINFADGFAYKFNWAGLGQTIRSTLTNFIKNLNLDGAMNAFTNIVNGLVTSAITLIGTPNFRQWGANVATGIRNTLAQINWGGISSLFSMLVIGALDFIDGMVVTINWAELGNNIAQSFTEFFSDGGDGNGIIKSMANTFSNLLWGLFTSLDTIVNSVEWGSLGENLATALSDFINPDEDESWISLLSKTANDIINALLDFINGVFNKQETADDFANGFSEMLGNFDWEGIFIKAMSAILNIGSWIIQLASDLVNMFCQGLATGFSKGENNKELNEAISGLGKAIGNLFITAIEALLNILVSAVPNFILGLGKLLLNALAGLVGLVLGEEWYNNAVNGLWGENSWKMDPITIPRLATGAYVPANYGEFLAVLGDNKREAEIVAPESKLEEAVINAMSKLDIGGGDINITLQVGEEVLGTTTVKWNDRYKKRHGKSAFA